MTPQLFYIITHVEEMYNSDSPFTVLKLVLQVPPPEIVYDCELYQSREYKGCTGAHPDIQSLGYRVQ